MRLSLSFLLRVALQLCWMHTFTAPPPHDPSLFHFPFRVFRVGSQLSQLGGEIAQLRSLRKSEEEKHPFFVVVLHAGGATPPQKKWASSAEMGSVKGDVQRRQQKGAVSSTHQRFFWGRDIGPVLQSVLHMCCCHASWTHARADYGGCRSREPIEERGHKRKKKGESCIGEGIYWSSKSAASADLLSAPRRLNWIGPPSLGGDRTQQRMFKVIFFWWGIFGAHKVGMNCICS